MKREIIAILTLGSFIVFSLSCYSVQQINPEMLSAPKADKIEIRKVDKTSGESVIFAKSNPGHVRGNFVEGTGTLARAVEYVEIASADLQTVTHQDKTFLSVKTRDGKSYGWVKKIVEQGDKSVLYVVKIATQKVTSSFKISLSEMEKVWAKRYDKKKTKTAIYMMGLVIGMCLIVATNKPHHGRTEWSSLWRIRVVR
jgi:hypothetical protein